MRKKLVAGLSLLVMLVLSAGIAGAAKTYRAERFDANWDILPGGALAVVETVTFRFSGGPFTTVYREIPSAYSDGVEVLGAAMDGKALPAGTGPGQVEIERGDKIVVTWRFPETSDAARTFELTYRVNGAVRREAGQDLLTWNFLPTEYEYPIDSATLRVRYPQSAARVGPAEVRRGNAAVSETGSEAVFSAAAVSHGTPLTVALRFAEGSLIETLPAWQQHAAEVQGRAPGPIALAAAVLAAGAGWLALRWRGGSDERRSPRGRPTALPSEPSDLSPALAGSLVNADSQATAMQALATLFGLAQKGIVVIEETAEKTWYRSAEFTVRRLPAGTGQADLRPYEQALLELLFDKKDALRLSEAGTRLASKLSPFKKAVSAELEAQGLVDPARRAFGRRFIVIGLALLGLMAVTGVGAIFTVDTYGGWLFLAPAALFLLSMAAFVMAGAYSRRSAAGEEAAWAWQGFRLYLKGVTKGREPAYDTQLFDRYFTYAAAFGLPDGWAKAFRQQGGKEIPAWFKSLSLNTDDGMAAFIAMTSVAHSSGTSGGSAGSGGAGGGGASGAS